MQHCLSKFKQVFIFRLLFCVAIAFASKTNIENEQIKGQNIRFMPIQL